MEKTEIRRIADFLSDVYEGICEQDSPDTQRLQLDQLYQIIKTLMDETFKTKDQDLKILLASLEYIARKCKQHIERRQLQHKDR